MNNDNYQTLTFSHNNLAPQHLPDPMVQTNAQSSVTEPHNQNQSLQNSIQMPEKLNIAQIIPSLEPEFWKSKISKRSADKDKTEKNIHQAFVSIPFAQDETLQDQTAQFSDQDQSNDTSENCDNK